MNSVRLHAFSPHEQAWSGLPSLRSPQAAHHSGPSIRFCWTVYSPESPSFAIWSSRVWWTDSSIESIVSLAHTTRSNCWAPRIRSARANCQVFSPPRPPYTILWRCGSNSGRRIFGNSACIGWRVYEHNFEPGIDRSAALPRQFRRYAIAVFVRLFGFEKREQEGVAVLDFVQDFLLAARLGRIHWHPHRLAVIHHRLPDAIMRAADRFRLERIDTDLQRGLKSCLVRLVAFQPPVVRGAVDPRALCGHRDARRNSESRQKSGYAAPHF